MECKITMLVKEMDIYWLMIHSEQIESEMLKKLRMWESKGAHFKSKFSNVNMVIMVILNKAKGSKVKGHPKLLIKILTNIGYFILRSKVRL